MKVFKDCPREINRMFSEQSLPSLWSLVIVGKKEMDTDEGPIDSGLS